MKQNECNEYVKKIYYGLIQPVVLKPKHSSGKDCSDLTSKYMADPMEDVIEI